MRFFTGREAALRAITEWFRNPADARACVITGRPGTGKSTILARLAADSGTTVRPLSARGRTLAGITQEIARGFGFDGVAAQAERATGEEARKAAAVLISAFAGTRHPAGIAVDGLDEAVEPREIARELLTGLAALPHVRVLVASRPEVRPDRPGPRVPSLGSALEVDLDRPEYADPAAVKRYAEQVLGEAPAYRSRPELIHEMASAIARKSGNVFLIARILSRTAAEAPQPLSPEALETLSDRAGSAFDEYLDRFDAAPPGGMDKRSVVDLLEPLAWAEGEGLPWEHIWAPLARAISGRDYSDSDIRVLLERAGAFVIESRSHGHSVYRLYHALLAEHLRDASRAADIHRRIAFTLDELTPDWTLAHPYVRAWLPIHAAKGGVLGRFLKDPLFLVSVEPAALSRATALASGTLTPFLARLCSSVVFDLHSVHTIEDALSYLELHARQCGAGELARRIAALPVKRRWSVPWARWNVPAAHRLLARLRGFVKVAASEVNGVPALITSSGDGIHTIDLQTNEVRELRAGTGPLDMSGRVAGASSPERPLAAVCRGDRIEVWDLGTSSVIAELAAETEKRLDAVHIFAAERTFVVASADSGTVYIWDLEHGTTPICSVEAHSDEVMAVIAARLGDRDVVAFGSKDGTVLVWDIAARQPIARFANAKRWVFSLAVAKRSGRDVILAGYFGGEIIAWDPLTGERAGEPLESRIKPDFAIYGIAPGEIDGRPAIVTAESDGAIRVRDLETGEALRQPMKGHEPHTAAWSLALVHKGGRTMAISGGSDGTVRAWDLGTGRAPGEATSETPTYGALAIAKRRGKTVILGVKTGLDATVHVLDAETGAVIEQPFPVYELWLFQSAAATEIGGKTVVAFGSYDGNVSAFNVKTRKSAGGQWPRCRGHTRVAFSELNGRHVLAVADEAPAIHLFDFLKGGTLWTVKGAHGKKAIWAIGAGTLEGRAVILSSGFDGMLRVWDAETRAPVAAIEKGDLQVEAITLAPLGGRSRLVFGTQHGSLHITDLDGKTQAVIHVGSQVESVVVAPESTIVVATARGLLSIRWHAS